eukprot:jgi/Tetstr1/434158/TSEL_002482.t1
MCGAQADDEEELELNYEENDSAMEVDTAQRVPQRRHQSSPASQPAIAAELASLTAEPHQLRNPQCLSIQLDRHPSQPSPTGKGKAATTAKHKKKKPGAVAARTAPPATATGASHAFLAPAAQTATGKRTMMQPTRLAARTTAATVIVPYWPDRGMHQRLSEMASEEVVFPPSPDLFAPGRLGVRSGVGPPKWPVVAFRLPLWPMCPAPDF